MEMGVIKYCKLFILLLVVAPATLPPIASASTIPLPVCYTFISSQSITYTPEFNLSTDSVVIPLKRAGRLFVIEARVDDQVGNLVFDTGANGLVLNATYFRDHVKTGGTISNGITGAVGVVEQISVNRIELPGLAYKNVRADVANLGHIENRRGIKILGLIGFSMMKKLEIVIDSKNNQLVLIRIDKSGKRINSASAEFKAEYVQRFENNSNILFLKGKIAGKNLSFCFDTGAETNAISSDSNKSILNTLTITRRSALKGAGSASSEVLFGRMNDFSLGEIRIREMETIITNLDALSDAYGTKVDGMLGYNFLEQGIVCINFVKKQFGIRFTKREEK